MKVTFIKQHPAGIPEGTIKDLNQAHAERLEKEGYVSIEEPDPMSPDAGNGAPANTVVDLTKKTKAELEVMLTEKGVAFEPDKLKKDELIEKLNKPVIPAE